MKLKIERPNWDNNGCPECGSSVNEYNFEKWFGDYVEPINKILAEGIEVGITSTFSEDYEMLLHDTIHRQKMSTMNIEVEKEYHTLRYGDEKRTHKAIIIDIKPVERERPESVLEDLVKCETKDDLINLDVIRRAKAVLGNEI